MWKTQDAREQEILATLKAVAGVDPARVDAIEAWFMTLSSRERNTLHDSLSRGNYTNAKPGLLASNKAQKIQAHDTEKLTRKYMRALVAVMVAKSMYDQPNQNLQFHIQRSGSTGATDMFAAQFRIKSELTDFDQSRTKLINTNQSLNTWEGWERSKCRPLLVGCNIGRRGANGPGTLGCFVTIGHDIYILSNEHVLNQGGIDNMQADDQVIQPAHQCGGTFFDVIADSIRTAPDLDAAIAKVVSGTRCSPSTAEGRRITGSGAVQVDQIVYKRGCASKARIGLVTNANSPNVNKPGTVAVNQFLVRTHDTDPQAAQNIPFQVQGDSGSVVLDAANRVVGLLHGQAPGHPNIGQATHIGPILARFNCQILTNDAVAP